LGVEVLTAPDRGDVLLRWDRAAFGDEAADAVAHEVVVAVDHGADGVGGLRVLDVQDEGGDAFQVRRERALDDLRASFHDRRDVPLEPIAGGRVRLVEILRSGDSQARRVVAGDRRRGIAAGEDGERGCDGGDVAREQADGVERWGNVEHAFR
jgi:hypothetical protein